MHLAQPLLEFVLDSTSVLLDNPVGGLSGDSGSGLIGDPADAPDAPELCLGVTPTPSLAPRTEEPKP
ncbi:hypothetical protein [Streptomyces sp. NPDC020681]|uniref:hypothetical protein n=1 Tax=Streptomyces sp. NPDC020681 TaxID=3365083 RepID=UPI0037B16A2F